MRILAAADIHGLLRIYRWLAGTAAEHKADLLVLAGDLFGPGDTADHREQAAEIVPLLKQVSAPVFYLMGNDDFCWLGYEDEQIRCLHGKRFELGGYNFVGYQYTLPFIGGIFEKPEAEMEKDLRALEPLVDERTVLVTHGPAYGVLDQVAWAGHVGSTSLASLLERRPWLAHIHGHIHECFGREGNHFNAASAGHQRAFLIEVPSLNHHVLQAPAARLTC